MEEEDQLIGIYINGLYFVEPDLFSCQPVVDGYLVDKKTGTCIKANASNSNFYLYSSPFKLEQNKIELRMNSQNWCKLLVADTKFSKLKSGNTILIFEIYQNTQQKNIQEIEKKRIALAYLIPVASNGSMNVNQEIKLQLFKIKKDCKISHKDCSIYHLYADHKLKKLFGYLQILVKGVIPVNSKISNGSQNQTKQLNLTEKKICENIPAIKPVLKVIEWTRLPTQSCKIPNSIYKTITLGKNGFSCLQFSRSGTQLAAAALTKIAVVDVITGSETALLSSHIGFIYEIDWSLDDSFLLSVSNDCLGAVWSLKQKCPLYVLPHPTYIYCGKWFGSERNILTGGKDNLIRYWHKNDKGFELMEEINGHFGFVSSLAVQDNCLMISGDSTGVIIIHKFADDKWSSLKKLAFSEMSQRVIDSIHIHSSRRRIIVSVRSRSSYLVDIVSGVILQNYKSQINTLAHSVSCLTPCGSFLFSFCQNGDVGVWEVNTGKLFATYNNLFPIDQLTELSGFIHYHPHEHMLGIIALTRNCPLLILKYTVVKDDSEKLGLTFADKKN